MDEAARKQLEVARHAEIVWSVSGAPVAAHADHPGDAIAAAIAALF